MKKEYESKYHDLEIDHFWFKARRNYILGLLKDAPRDAKILDIGCSSGILLHDLIALGFKNENLYGIDISDTAVHRCTESGIQNAYVMDAQDIKIDQKFDYIIASDCLEHLAEDQKALKIWQNLLKPDGVAYIFVPAFMALWSHHDVVNMHYRRYTKNELKSKVVQGGFEIVNAGYWNFFLFAPIYVVRSISRLFKKESSDSSGDLEERPMFNGLFKAVLNLENNLLGYFNFPFGVSTFCVVRKPSDP